jgi:hypothetical protein
MVSSASRAFDSPWLEEFANCTPTAEKMTNAGALAASQSNFIQG